jgi:enoyl-CoA hydratase
MATNVQLSREDSIATITIDRPEKRNAMDIPTRKELRAALEECEHDDVRVVVLRGAGDGSFIAGGDIDMFREFNVMDGLEFANRYSQDLYNYVAEFPKPTVAAIDGYALGGGTEIAIACDIRIATENAKFGLPEASIGLFPAAGGTQRLIDIVGTGMAKELIFTGRILDAHEAEDIDLVNHVYEEGAFEDELESLCQEIASKAPIALRLAKESINRGLDHEAGLDFERVAGALLYGTDDKVEGIDAFKEDRSPEFTGQ